MKWSLRVGEFAGIGVYLHFTFLFLLGWIALAAWLQTGSAAAAAATAGFAIALFVSVVLHEYGHALMARRFGIPTRDITLLPIGGVARLERMPTEPRQEMLVALAGPLVNIVIAASIWLWLPMLTGFGAELGWALGLGGSGEASVGLTVFLERLAQVNVFLALFNLIPAFPMDGGRVLRAALAMRTSYPSATAIAAAIGRMAAVVFGLVGLVTNPFLVLIAVFVWIAAGQEAQMVRMRAGFEEARLRA
jgi:Zn-dependent protease